MTKICRFQRSPVHSSVAGPCRTTFLELCVGRLSFADVQDLVCVVFPDIAAAFYAAVRQLAAPVPLQSLDEISPGLGISEGDLAELAKLVQQPCALEADGASAWLIHTGTWMQVLGTQPDPMVTKRGTRPGSAWADVTFATILKRVLAYRDALHAHPRPHPLDSLGWGSWYLWLLWSLPACCAQRGQMGG